MKCGSQPCDIGLVCVCVCVCVCSCVAYSLMFVNQLEYCGWCIEAFVE